MCNCIPLKLKHSFKHLIRLAPLCVCVCVCVRARVRVSILECYMIQNNLECSVSKKKRVKRNVFMQNTFQPNLQSSSSHIRYLVITNAINLNSQ